MCDCGRRLEFIPLAQIPSQAPKTLKAPKPQQTPPSESFTRGDRAFQIAPRTSRTLTSCQLELAGMQLGVVCLNSGPSYAFNKSSGKVEAPGRCVVGRPHSGPAAPYPSKSQPTLRRWSNTAPERPALPPPRWGSRPPHSARRKAGGDEKREAGGICNERSGTKPKEIQVTERTQRKKGERREAEPEVRHGRFTPRGSELRTESPDGSTSPPFCSA